MLLAFSRTNLTEGLIEKLAEHERSLYDEAVELIANPV